MKTAVSFKEVRELAAGRLALVPTMGFLHEGHLSLVEAARNENDSVAVSIFVNPLQFDESGDLDAYPRDSDRDAALMRSAGADVLFLPDVATMYPTKPLTSVQVEQISDAMEGVSRPGHFTGVATVVAKLFAGIQPDTAYFGRKDAQQLSVVRRMATDLSFPVDVRGLPTIREHDGLALSSRNVRIEDHLRHSAHGLSRSLFTAADAFEAGERSVETLLQVARRELGSISAIDVEYIEMARVSDAATLDLVEEDEVFIAIAARVGDNRLIDNVTLNPTTGLADRGDRLGGPSILYGEH
jgi:pantoate--beta-alanine ligase